jgi:hypothetical protein
MSAWNRRLGRSFGIQENFDFKMLRRGDKMNGNAGSGQLGGRGGRGVCSCQSGDPRPEGGAAGNDFTAQSFPGQEVSKTASKQHLLHRVHHVTVSRFSWLVQSKPR